LLILANQNITQMAEKRTDCCYLFETFIRHRKKWRQWCCIQIRPNVVKTCKSRGVRRRQLDVKQALMPSHELLYEAVCDRAFVAVSRSDETTQQAASGIVCRLSLSCTWVDLAFVCDVPAYARELSGLHGVSRVKL